MCIFFAFFSPVFFGGGPRLMVPIEHAKIFIICRLDRDRSLLCLTFTGTFFNIEYRKKYHVKYRSTNTYFSS